MKKQKTKWYTCADMNSTKDEKVLRFLAKLLYFWCNKRGIDYGTIYIVNSEGSTTVNMRAKKGETVVVDGYAFVR